MSTKLKIAIIGAGPAGCILARLLLQGSPDTLSVTIFEAEKALDFRSQGGTLDLHTESGLAALKKAGLYDEFLKYARFDGEAFVVADKKLLRFINVGGTKESSSRGRPEIDRPRLRQLLLESLPASCIRWGKKLRRVDEALALHFDDGAVEGGFDLVVGADGAWSKVRPLLSSVTPHYSGIAGYGGSIPNAEQAAPEVYKLVNRGSFFAFSDHKAIMAQQMGDGSIQALTWSVCEEQPARRFGEEEGAAIKKKLREEFHDWSPEIWNSIELCDDDSMLVRSLYMLPVGHSWNHRPGVTLLGDAAHLMTPFAGEGVNLAFSDAMSLAAAIIDSTPALKAETPGSEIKDVLSRKVKEFEAQMFVRAKKVQQMTYDMMSAQFFEEKELRHTIAKYVLTAASDQIPGFAYPLLAAAVYTYFFIFKLLY